ncbi:unnamed protein product [Rhodiola kirilowii]
MNCLQSLHRSAVLLPPFVGGVGGMKPTPDSVNMLGVKSNATYLLKRNVSIKHQK